MIRLLRMGSNTGLDLALPEGRELVPEGAPSHTDTPLSFLVLG